MTQLGISNLALHLPQIGNDSRRVNLARCGKNETVEWAGFSRQYPPKHRASVGVGSPRHRDEYRQGSRSEMARAG